ncbi:ROK family protein [Mahella australiensis]|uniref:Glucokinase n=1 Tax=Mahella australiensis (strain DSM 15567 / CIP 107919 / 50-1 BON) TaxID=697281 RepID=F4A1K0_MAHA5|nr:ROK family protein [Mahella australiensis]AEE96034.1 glucokinase, ROK family [Mahella australiensis 50-1 BON]
MNEKYIAGIDLGGTTIQTVLTDENYNIVTKYKSDTLAKEGPDAVIERMMDAIDHVLEESKLSKEDLLGIGLGIPGLMDIEKGISLFAGNLSWENIQVVQPFKDRFNVPVYMDNDVRVNALGEWYFGAGRGVKNMVLITLGTGVGAGIIIDGKMLRGPQSAAGEVGHMIIVEDGPACTCGSRGCLEVFASATGMMRRCKELMLENRDSLLWQMCDGDIDKVRTHMIDKAHDQGDKVGRQVMAETAYYLGIGLTNVVNIFNPELVVIGGGVSKAGERLLGPARDFVNKRAMVVQRQHYKLVAAQMLDEAGMLGACTLAKENLP